MEQRLKERLTGTVVLVLLAVIVIPLLLDDNREQETGRITTTNIPEKPDDTFTTRLIPILEQDEILPVEEHVEEVPAAAVEEIDTHTGKAANRGEPAATAPAASAETENKSLTGWVVQVGSFTRENADKLNDELQAAGYRSYIVDEPVTGGDGSLVYQVRVGPEVLRSEAMKLQAELKKDMKLDGFVLNYP